MKKNKKGDMSLNIIIIAVIGLLVLVVISVIFMQKMGILGGASANCEAKGGICQQGTSCQEGYAPLLGQKCMTGDTVRTGEVCCAKVGA